MNKLDFFLFDEVICGGPGDRNSNDDNDQYDSTTLEDYVNDAYNGDWEQFENDCDRDW